MNKILTRFVAGVLLLCAACQRGTDEANPTALFESVPAAKAVTPGIIDEASGIADSKANPGHVWVEQDSGNPNAIGLLSYNGSLAKSIHIKPATNRDWEDMAPGNGPVDGENYIYLADIGDNNPGMTEYAIFRFIEPSSTTDTVFNCDKLRFQYPDGPHDAEAIFVDNATKDIYLITKQDNPSKIYRLAYPQNTSMINIAIAVGNLAYNGVTGAALSPSGNELLVRSYTSVNYWKRNNGETIAQMLSRTPITLTVAPEPQGEAICWRNDNSGFYTLSERPSPVNNVFLNFYSRK